MAVPRSLLLSVAVVLAVLLVALPVAAGGGAGNASAPKEIVGSSAQAPGGPGAPSATPTAGTTAVASATTLVPAAEVPTATIRESGGAANGERTVAGDATTVPTATPSAGSGARAGGTGPAAAGGNETQAGHAAVPTETPTPAGQVRSGAGGDGGGAPTASPTAGAKAGSTATASPASTPQPTRSAAGTAPGGTGQDRDTAVGDSNAGDRGSSGSPVVAASAAVDGGAVSVPVPVEETPRAGRSPGGRTEAGPGPSPAVSGATSVPAGGTVAPDAGRHGTGGAVLSAPAGTPGRHGEDGRNGTGDRDGAGRDGPRPTVSPGAGDPYGPGYLARVGAALPAHGDRAGRGGADRDGPRGPARHGDGGRRGPPANPEPLAPPVRTGLEPPEPTGGPAGRAKKEPLRGPFTADAEGGAPDPFLLLRFLLFLGYRRVRPGNLLEHPVRRDLAAAVAADPGLDLAGCVAATGANRETLRYHLALLVCGGRVVEETRNGAVGYFPAGTALSPAHRALLQLRRNPSLAPVLFHIRDAPGVSRRELADRLGVAGPSVTRQVQRLFDEGLVERRRCGQSQRYWLTPACAGAFATIALADGARDRGVVSTERATA